MSKERELLNKAIEMIQIVPLMASIGHAAPDFGSELILEIQELLAQPEQTEQDQEPVAWIIETEIHGKLSEWVCTDKKHYMEAHDSIKEPIPLYTAPPKREPLSSIKILELTSKHEYAINLIRAIEKAHGIGGEE